MAAQCFDSGSRRTATLGLCDPQNAIRFRPTVPNRAVFQQAGEKAVRFSIRSRKALLSSGFATCTLCVALLGGVLPLRIISRREPRNQALDRTLSCSQAMGYYGMDRSGQFGISAAEVLGKSRNRPAGRFRNGPSDKSGDRSGGVLREGTMTAVAQYYTRVSSQFWSSQVPPPEVKSCSKLPRLSPKPNDRNRQYASSSRPIRTVI